MFTWSLGPVLLVQSERSENKRTSEHSNFPEEPSEMSLGTQHSKPWEDPKDRSTLGLYNLHHSSTRVPNWGVPVFGSSQGSG